MSAKHKRSVFYVSDRTGITVETMGRSLLSQFDGLQIEKISLPFVDTMEKAEHIRDRINAAAARDGIRPLVFSTLVNAELRAIIAGSEGMCVDFFDTYLGPLEAELEMDSSHTMGRSHGMSDTASYDFRMDAVNYALNTDDGLGLQNYAEAEIIVVGVSRCGKTPTCLYLALQYGIHAANYPLSEEELEQGRLPSVLQAHRQRLFGLQIAPDRLSSIRNERRPGSRYASLRQCAYETRQLQALFQRAGIQPLDSTRMSVEEIATHILAQTGLQPRAH